MQRRGLMTSSGMFGRNNRNKDSSSILPHQTSSYSPTSSMNGKTLMSSTNKHHKNKVSPTLARVTFILVLFWPLGWLLYSYIMVNNVDHIQSNPMSNKNSSNLVTSNKKIVSKAALAFAVYGKDHRIVNSVQSILDTTSHIENSANVLAILPILDGVDKSTIGKELENELKSKVDAVTGTKPPMHIFMNDEENVMGVTRSRLQVADFINILATNANVPAEKVVFVLIRGDSELQPGWVDPVLEALHLGGGGSAASVLRPQYDMEDPLKLSNIVSLSALYSGKDTSVGTGVSFSYSLDPIWSDAFDDHGKANQSAGLAGAVSAMRLSTFQNLVVQDKMLYSAVSADLSLALNVWMCGDGIDVLPDAFAKVISTGNDSLNLTDYEAARIAGTWMTNSPYSSIVFHARGGDNAVDRSMKNVIEEMQDQHNYHVDVSRCRSFDWFVDNVNKDWREIANQIRKEEVKNQEPARLENHPTAAPVKRFTDATDKDGNLGYIYDETWLRNVQPISEKMSCNKDIHYKMLTEKVELASPSSNAPTIMCVVYTTHKNHRKIPAITSTWGPQCDGFLVASDKTVTEPGLHTVNILHEGPEEYNNIWQKIRSIWRYVYENYYDKYDYFHIGGDDLFVIVENMKYYLESDEIASITNSQELFMGRRFAEQGNVDRIFNSGGSGYTMNKRAMKMLATNLFEREDRVCGPHAHTFAEDVMVASCFRANNVYPYDTRDEFGSERYMPFKPGHHLTYQAPKDVTKDWYSNYMSPFNLKFGLDHCSKYSVAYHYVEPEEMKRFYSITHGLCTM